MTLRRAVVWSLLSGSLLLPAACSGRGATQPAAMCQTIPWGGWNGTPDCAGIAASVIQGQDRGCQQDTDCVLVAASSCSAHTVSTVAQDRYRTLPPPCNHPLAGMCASQQWYAVCQQGCCVPSNQPPPPPGFTPAPGY